MRASRQFSDEQRQRINAAIAEAERATGAEIVPAVASASGRYDRAEDLAGLWLGALAMAGVFVLLPDYTEEAGSWAGTSTVWKLGAMLAALAIGFVVGAAVVSRAWRVRRLFTPRRQMRDEARRAAGAAFYDSSIHHTAGGSGLLIYVSLYERTAVVLADEAIVERVGQAAIDGLCAKLTGRLGEADATTALVEAIADAGAMLGPVLPRAEGDVNELPDELVVID